MSKNKKPKVKHIEYNHKVFIAPNSIRSMSVIHCKIKENGEGIIRISDCNNSIRIWNDLNVLEEQVEIIEKINNIVNSLEHFKRELIERNIMST